MENLVNDLTQKDEIKAQNAALKIIDTKNIDAYKSLCKKSEFLYEFVKNNVRKRLLNAITKDNFNNVKAFFDVYSDDYADALISGLSKFASEEISDELYEMLENGNDEQKAYASKYFCYIPDTIAQDKLEELAYSQNTNIATNSAQALGVMNDEKAYEKAISDLNSNDDFELIKTVRFLTYFGNKNATNHLLNTLSKTSMAENIAGEIPYLMPISEMIKTQDFSLVLSCFDYILAGLGETLSFSQVFDFEIYETIQYLINNANTTRNSQIASVLLRAYERFSTFTSNDEYIFDEQKDVKDEVKAISELLLSQNNSFWQSLKEIIANELKQEKQRIIAALEIIKALEIDLCKNELVEFINSCHDEQLLLLSVSVAKTLQVIKKLDKSDICNKVHDTMSNAVVTSYFD